jgi:threonine aldolase
MSPRRIDLRSDTVTLPTPAMRKAMAEAEVGDDVFGEDPSVNALQEEAAALLGKEAALFVASGTMANQVALKAHTQAGDEVVAHPLAHIVRAESAAGAALAGVQFRPVGEDDGTMDPAKIEAVIQSGDNPHFAPTRLVCVENTHNLLGGTVWPLAKLDAVAALAKRHKLLLHMDGARIMNAAIALDARADRIAAAADSVSMCFSKGLGAPVGSVIAGPKAYIVRCTRYRKMYGGGMRQAGILAAAARHALKHHVERLAEDHANARLLAEGLAQSRHITFPNGMPQTNLVFFGCAHPTMTLERLLAGLKERGILVGQAYGTLARAVTHLDVGRADVERTVAAVRDLLKN